MATIAAVEKQIFEREGFRVTLVPLTERTKSLPDYDYAVMAPQRWRISDWKNARLAPYVTLLRGVTVFRGDGSTVGRDLQLGNLRDSYYEAAYGAIGPANEEPASDKVVPLKPPGGKRKR